MINEELEFVSEMELSIDRSMKYKINTDDSNENDDSSKDFSRISN